MRQFVLHTVWSVRTALKTWSAFLAVNSCTGQIYILEKYCICFKLVVWSNPLFNVPCCLVPETEVKGESSHYFLLVQGSDDNSGTCRVRILLSDSQLNGSAAMATVTELLRESSLPTSGIHTFWHFGLCLTETEGSQERVNLKWGC